jgi:hypothetical protein
MEKRCAHQDTHAIADEVGKLSGATGDKALVPLVKGSVASAHKEGEDNGPRMAPSLARGATFQEQAEGEIQQDVSDFVLTGEKGWAWNSGLRGEEEDETHPGKGRPPGPEES